MKAETESLPSEMIAFARLMDAHRFYEAHEVLEDLWVVEVAPLKEFYKGLIMASVALCHWQRGNRASALRMKEVALARLAKSPAGFGGVDVSAYVVAMSELFRELEANPRLAWSRDLGKRLPPVGW